MDDETQEMERISCVMRAAMQKWVDDPRSDLLKRQFLSAQQRYQRLFEEYKRRQQQEASA